MLPTVSAIQNRDGVTDVFDSDLVDRDISVIPLILDIFHGCTAGRMGCHVRISVSVIDSGRLVDFLRRFARSVNR